MDTRQTRREAALYVARPRRFEAPSRFRLPGAAWTFVLSTRGVQKASDPRHGRWHDGAEFRIVGFPKCLIQALAVQAGILCYLTHAAGTCDEAERVANEIRVTSFERRRDIGSLTFFSVEIVGGIKSCRLAHLKFSAGI